MLLKAREAGTDPFAAIETVLPWDTFADSVAEAQGLAQPAEFDFLHHLSEKYQTLRRHAPALLDVLQLRAAPAATELLAAIQVLRAMNADNVSDLPSGAPTGFFKSLASELQPASEVLLLGHGKGKSNASHLFESYVEKHRRDIANKIVASVRCDVDDITDNQLLRLGETYFGEDVPERDYPDSRRGEPRPGETQQHAGT